MYEKAAKTPLFVKNQGMWAKCFPPTHIHTPGRRLTSSFEPNCKQQKSKHGSITNFTDDNAKSDLTKVLNFSNLKF